jgi:hypothetical protein
VAALPQRAAFVPGAGAAGVGELVTEWLPIPMPGGGLAAVRTGATRRQLNGAANSSSVAGTLP